MTAEALDISLLNETQRRHLLWKAGNLSYMVLPYQRDVYDSLWAWQASKHKIELRRAWKAKGAKYHSLWLFEIGRRWGKTVLVILFLIEFCIRRPGSVGLLCTAYQNSIGSIILKIIRTVFEPEAPPGYCPEYRTSMDGESQILFIPAVNATIKLVGLDLHSGKTRGNFQDFVAITEAGFVTDLHDTYTSVIQPQMKGRPWAWSLMESSTSDIPDHDFQTVLKEDAQLRDAHTFRTIDDTDLTDEEIELELDSVGGRDSAIAQREYYCRIVVDEQRAVIPEFDEGLHLLEPEQHTRPLYAFGITSLDPGVRDKCGLVFFYLDFLSASLVVQSSWAESNQNTVQIAEVIRETERELWQAQQSPLKPPKPISIQDLLKPTAEVLRLGSGQQHSTEIAGARVLPGNVVWTAPEGSMTWWDDEKRSLRANPARRVSDVATQLQLDLRQLHGLSFDTAFKGPGSRKAHINNLRVLFKQCRIKILKTPENAQLIAQLRSGRWNEKQTDFEPSKTLGHLDALMALAYGVRVVPWEKNPYRPTHVDPNEPDLFVSAIYEKKVMRPQSTRRRHGR